MERHLAPAPAHPIYPNTTIYLYFRGGKRCLFPSPGFFGLFLCLSNQLFDEAPRDDREQGRWRGWRGALVFFSNLCVEGSEEGAENEPASQGSLQTACDTAWEEHRGQA